MNTNENISTSSEGILFQLKTTGAQTTEAIAEQFNMTTVGARHHLNHLSELQLIRFFDKRETVGRPKRYWELTSTGHSRFPNTHSQLTVEMISAIREVFGEQGLSKVIKKREKELLRHYKQEMATCKTIQQKVKTLSQLRDQEGYMARYKKCSDGSYLLIEDHCPICAAATECQGFCQSELNNFQKAMGTECTVSREEYLLDGGKRCSYRVELIK